MAKQRKNTRTPQQNFAIKEKVEQLMSEGIREDRAVAAAFRMYRDGELRSDIANTPKLDRRLQEQRRAIRRRRRLVVQPGAAIVDLSTAVGFTALYKRLKKGLK